MPRTRRHKADRGRCISRAARDKRDLGGDRCDTAPDARRQHMVLEDPQGLETTPDASIWSSKTLRLHEPWFGFKPGFVEQVSAHFAHHGKCIMEEPIAAAQATRHTHA